MEGKPARCESGIMWKIVVIAIIAAAGVIGWLYWDQHQTGPLVVSGFIEADEIRVGSRVGGRVAAVKVVEGQHLKSGEPLFSIEPFDLQDQLAQAQAELAGAKAELDRLKAGFRAEEIEQARAKRDAARSIFEKLVAGPRPEEIRIAEEELKRVEASQKLAQTEFDRLSKLKQEGRAAQVEYDQAVRQVSVTGADVAAATHRLALLRAGTRKEEIAQANATLAEAEAALKLMEAGYRSEDIAKAAAQVAAAQAKVAAIQVRVKDLVVVAPTDCVVEAIDLRPGDLVSANAPAVSLLEVSHLWVRAYVPESRLGEVRLGEEVPIRADAFLDKRFHGKLTFISQEAEFTPRNVQTPEERSKLVFRIKVTLDEGLDQLRPGMIADVLLGEANSR